MMNPTQRIALEAEAAIATVLSKASSSLYDEERRQLEGALEVVRKLAKSR
jgi:hypothetical protein